MKISDLTQQLNTVEEYEREPVPSSTLKNWKSYLGLYAGEHTAGTEFVIGPLFVAHGATAGDLLGGLLLGNILAVLSWALLCAPIAVRERITMYFKLEKICGPTLSKVYNVVNGVMFCFLAGSMITVSATAVGIPFDLPLPTLNDLYPNSLTWVVIVLVVGLVTTLVAMLGYHLVSYIANLAAPWLFLVFLAAAIAVLPELGVSSVGDFWEVANTKIWTGTPLEGQSKFGFWHIVFFAWFCNMAMHIGMADMSILRYANHWKAGFGSASGMFLGHYIAWTASGILYAIFLQNTTNKLAFSPGPVAYYAAGIAGVVCVIIAGWTTANPTIYRAGLALQSLSPRWKTWKVTLVVGAITTITAIFPAFVMNLLDLVALYGLLLMPMGAVIFADVYLLPKLNLPTEKALKQKWNINWAAAVAWVLTLALCLGINQLWGVEIFFLGLPGWFIAVGLYVGGSWVAKS
ncbi:MAG: purine-cytosine permease family protein [Runella sp.]